MALRLEDLRNCLDGIVPAAIATCSADGVPNATYLSQVHYVDPRHVALSRQFFSKTVRNLEQNPLATVRIRDPFTLRTCLLRVRFVRSETTGELFDCMAVRIDAIAAHTGMSGIFRLIAADVFEVLAIEASEGEMAPTVEGVETADLWSPPPDIPADKRSEIWVLQRLTGRVNRARTLEELFSVVLRTLNEDLGFSHARILIPDRRGKDLVVRASFGFGEAALGRRIPIGEGLIGKVAQEKQVVRLSRVEGQLQYCRAARGGLEKLGEGASLGPELPLPGLPDAQSHLILPLVAGDDLVAVLALESRNPLAFAAWHEAFLDILGHQVALALQRLLEDEEGLPVRKIEPVPDPGAEANRLHRFCLYRNDDCVFLDGDYLIRNVPARILWKLLTQYRNDGRTEFSNRELRLDPRLGLPELKDNLESRLILLRKRLQQRCPDVQLVPRARGRFAVQVACRLELVERESA
jgi:putative methionine-R-sulfoxide reductase with GAF domain